MTQLQELVKKLTDENTNLKIKTKELHTLYDGLLDYVIKLEDKQWNAETRISLHKEPKESSNCRHYLRGKCWYGERCKFKHPDITPVKQRKTPENSTNKPLESGMRPKTTIEETETTPYDNNMYIHLA